MDEERVYEDLMALLRSKPSYAEVIANVLEAWEDYKRKATCPKCGSDDVRIDRVYLK